MNCGASGPSFSQFRAAVRLEEGFSGRDFKVKVDLSKEIKTHEHRVGLTPGAVREYVAAGQSTIVETNAGAGIGAIDEHLAQGRRNDPGLRSLFDVLRKNALVRRGSTAVLQLLGNLLKIIFWLDFRLRPKKRCRIPAVAPPWLRPRSKKKIPRIFWRTNGSADVTLSVYVNYLDGVARRNGAVRRAEIAAAVLAPSSPPSLLRP